MRALNRRQFGVWTCAGMTAGLLGTPRPLGAVDAVDDYFPARVP